MDTEWGAQLAEIVAPGTVESQIAGYEFWMQATFAGEDPLAGTPFGQTMWERATEAAERHNDPGAFTAFIGFEWTSQPNGSNMHPQRESTGTARTSPTRRSRSAPMTPTM